MTGPDRLGAGVGLLAAGVERLFPELRRPLSPFGRLAFTHLLMVTGDAFMTVALAGSLFFSISPSAARDKVALYLVLTVAPFAVVAPALGPLLDRSRGARRAMVMLSAAARAVLAFFMARDLHSLLLFPEAFGVLVASKLYVVAKASLVPATVGPGPDLVRANSRLTLLGGLAGLVGGLPAAAVLKIPFLGAPWVLRLDVVVLAAATVAAARLPRGPRDAPVPERSGAPGDPADAGSPPAGSPPATPPPAGPPPAGPAARRRRRIVEPEDYLPEDHVGGGYGQLPGGREEDTAELPALGRGAGPDQAPPSEPLAAGGRRVPGTVAMASTATAVLRATVGLVTFFMAFGLRRDHAPTWWYGAVLVSSIAGSLAATLVAPLVRRVVREENMIVLALLAVAAAAGVAYQLEGGRWGDCALTFAVGLGASWAKLAFDSMVQRDVPELNRGRAFARFEMRFQLAWVLGGLVPVLITFSDRPGEVLVGVATTVAAVMYMAGRQGVRLRAAS